MTNEIVAHVYDDDDNLHDRCFTWETGQAYANAGYRVVAMADDGPMTVADAQRLYDYEREIAADCFGPGVRSEI